MHTQKFIIQLLNTDIESSSSEGFVCPKIGQSNYEKYGLMHWISSHIGGTILKMFSSHGGFPL